MFNVNTAYDKTLGLMFFAKINAFQAARIYDRRHGALMQILIFVNMA